MKKIRIFALSALASFGFGSLGGAEIIIVKELEHGVEAAANVPVKETGWIEAHEWGVQQYLWDKGTVRVPLNLPKFVHTRATPGIGKSAPTQIEQNVIALKPVLYFRSSLDDVKIDVEVGFSGGYPFAWYPQASKYMPSDQENFKGVFRGRLREPGVVSPYQLSWHNLELFKHQEDTQLDIPVVDDSDHWVHAVRNVDSMIVKNTKGAMDSYLFYEGEYPRLPDVAVLPGTNGSFTVVNVTNAPLHRVVVIYRDKKKGLFGYTRVHGLNIAKHPDHVTEAGFIRTKCGMTINGKYSNILPCAATPKTTFKTSKELSADLRQWFEKSLITKAKVGENSSPVLVGQLRADESKSLLDVWQKDLFETDGVTIVYAHSRAHLDQTIPLRITAPRGVRVVLRRSGLVLNRNIPMDKLKKLSEVIDLYCADEADAEDKKLLKTEKNIVLGMVRGELGGIGAEKPARMLHLKRLYAFLNL